METTEMTPEKSLRIMNDIIEKSRRDFMKNSGTPIILWGCLVLVTSLIVWILWHQTGNPAWNWLWFAMTPVGFLSQALSQKDNKPKAKTFLGEAIGYIWLTFCVFALSYALAAMFLAPLPITAGITLMLGLCLSLTGTLTKLKFITVMGFVTGVGGAIASRMVQVPENTILVITVVSLAMILTGVIMNFQLKRICSRS